MAPSFSFSLTSSPALFFLGPALYRTKRPVQGREARLLIIVLSYNTRHLPQGGFPSSVNFYVRTDVNFTRVKKVDAMCEKARVNVTFACCALSACELLGREMHFKIVIHDSQSPSYTVLAVLLLVLSELADLQIFRPPNLHKEIRQSNGASRRLMVVTLRIIR